MQTLKEILAKCALAVAGAGIGLMVVVFLGHQLWAAEDYRSELPPCFEIGQPYHHRYRPSCQGVMRSPQGPLSLATNEDGLRDAARAEILRQKDRILLLGDSFVEGWWLSQPQTLGARLQQTFPGTYFVNGGLRSTGPLFQMPLMDRLASIYRPRAVLLLLNDTDPADDKLACSLAQDISQPGERWEFGTADFEQSTWEKTLLGFLGEGRLGGKLKQWLYYGRWKDLMESQRGKMCGPCMGLKELKRLAEGKGLPLAAVYIQFREIRRAGPYVLDREARAQYLQCLQQLGIPHTVVDNAQLSPEEQERFFWPNDSHMTPAGIDFFVGRVSPWLKQQKIAP